MKPEAEVLSLDDYVLYDFDDEYYEDEELMRYYA